MQTQKVIEQLGFSPKEAKVYLAALHLGEAHISDIAAKVKLPRSSVQVIVDELYKQGLMNFYVMRRYKYWVAESPERLLTKIRQHEDDMREAMPNLIALKKNRAGKSSGRLSESDLGIFQILAEGSSQPILIATEEVNIAYANSAWEKQFGYTLDEVRGKNPRMLQSGKTPRLVYERMWDAMKADKMFQSDEIIDKKKNGSYFNLLTTIFPLRHNGRLFYIQILDDITERKRVEAMRKQFTHLSAT